MTPRKLGKLAPRHDLRTIHFANLLTPALPVSPPARDWLYGMPTDLGMMANDAVGDCGFASQAHAIQSWSFNQTGEIFTPPTADVLAAYSHCTGYDPADPSTDRGVVMLDALNSWRNYGISGRKIGAYAKVDHHNVDHVKAALNLFGGVYLGANLPLSAQKDGPWFAPAGPLVGDDAPGGWGGHCMWMASYDRDLVTFVTWGRRQTADWQWVLDYVDEMYAPVSVDWVTGAQPAPNGFDVTRLNAALSML